MLVRVGRHIVNIEYVADAHWEQETLYLHFLGGRFAQLRGREALLVWNAIEFYARDLEASDSSAGETA
jgi:hypothetical protein